MKTAYQVTKELSIYETNGEVALSQNLDEDKVGLLHEPMTPEKLITTLLICVGVCSKFMNYDEFIDLLDSYFENIEEEIAEENESNATFH